MQRRVTEYLSSIHLPIDAQRRKCRVAKRAFLSQSSAEKYNAELHRVPPRLLRVLAPRPDNYRGAIDSALCGSIHSPIARPKEKVQVCQAGSALKLLGNIILRFSFITIWKQMA